MKVEILGSALVITPTTTDEERLIFALAAAYKAFDSVAFPVTAQAVRYNKDDKSQLDHVQHHQGQDEKPVCTQQYENTPDD